MYNAAFIIDMEGYTTKTLINRDQLGTVMAVFLLHHVQSTFKVRQRYSKPLLAKIQPKQNHEKVT